MLKSTSCEASRRVCIPELCSSEGGVCLLLVLCANEAADVSPNPLQDDQEGQQVEEQSDSLEEGGGTDKREVDEGSDRYSDEMK